jgi:hypothetical protein
MSVVSRITSNKRGLIASLAAVAALGVTSAYTLGGFSASIADPTSTFSSATIQLQEGNGTTTCYSTGTGTGGTVTATNSGTCSGINVLTGTLDQLPGGTALTSTITLKNVGNTNATIATLATGACAAAAASDDNAYVGSDTTGFCGKVDVTIANTTATKCVYPAGTGACPALSNTYTLASLANATITTGMSTLAAGASATYVITAQLDSTAATNADQGLTATLPFTWSISQ